MLLIAVLLSLAAHAEEGPRPPAHRKGPLAAVGMGWGTIAVPRDGAMPALVENFDVGWGIGDRWAVVGRLRVLVGLELFSDTSLITQALTVRYRPIDPLWIGLGAGDSLLTSGGGLFSSGSEQQAAALAADAGYELLGTPHMGIDLRLGVDLGLQPGGPAPAVSLCADATFF